MTQNEVIDFLQQGALMSLPSGKLRLWRGPFEQAKSFKSGEFSIGYGTFFGSEILSFLSSQPVLEIDVVEFQRVLQGFLDRQGPSESGLTRHGFREPEKEKFLQSFQVIQGKIQRGEIEKAVPIVFSESSQTPDSGFLASMISNVLKQADSLYVYGFWHQGQGVLGASPEILFHQSGRLLKTMALAGTLPHNSQKSIQDFQKDPKEIREHQIVVDDICERLQKISRPLVGPREVVQYPGLCHFRTEIQLEVSEVDPLRWMKMLHPTAALGVFPRNYGIQWMQELSWQKQRGLFGSPLLFPISHSENIAIVAIRNIMWGPQGSQVGAGCGIVAASDFNKEWEELKAKRAFVFQILGIPE